MDDNRIEIVASLDIPKTVSTIEKDLEEVKKRLDANKALSIACSLDTNSLATLQNQVSEISKKLKIDIPKIEIQAGTGQSAQNIENVAQSVETVTNKVLTLKKTLADLDSRFVESFKAITNTDGIINAERTMAAIQSRLSSLGTVTVTGKYNDQESADSINKIIARIEAASGEVRELNFLLDSTGEKFEYIGGSYSDKGVGKIQQDLARLSKELANFEASHKSIESGLIEPLTVARNAIIDLESGTGSVESAQKALDNLKTVAANIGSNLKSTGSSFNVFDNAANKAKNFDNAIKTLKMDIESLSPSTNKSFLVSQLDLAIERMNEFKDVESKSGRGVEWSQRYSEISSLLQNITNNLKVAQKEENAFNKEFEQAVREEEKQLVIEQKRVEAARQLQEEQQHDYWQGRFEESVKGLTAENTELKALKEQLLGYNKSLEETEKQQKRAFQDNNRVANLQNRIKRLVADVNSYANANERVVKSNKQMSNGKMFSEEYSRIMTEMARGAELTDREVKDLAADFAVLKKEAKATGLEGASAFERFGKSFSLVSTYISANQLINMATSKIREAADELKAVDERLTEISKTSDRTAESLKRLGESSFDTASKYGRTASDYLYGVQEMSRAGFSEAKSEDMAELSILAQAAGDMTSELANEYLIATNAAYQYKGSVDKLNNSLDRQNYVTNHYALSMSDLAEATKIAASQAAQSGIGIDEMTAALSTMISTTQQGGEIAARSLRGILMNIQQVKGEVGDGEDDITTESLSKYEKAAKALGVSLKEVKDGAVTLRDPMIVLDELATAFNKEADNSIKKANLISAIGGKYRGNQLSALLSNWDTYKEILDTFNSDQAVGSAFAEAEKSANNWAGSLNKVKNSWTELVNQFLNSENAVSVIQSVDKIIQSFSNPEVVEQLKVFSDTIARLATLVGVLTEKFDKLPVILSQLSPFNGFKGVELFDGFIDDLQGVKDEIDEVVKAESALNDSSIGFKISGVDANIAESLRNKYDQITIIQEDASEKLSILIDGNLKTQLETAKKIRDEYGDIANRSDEVYQSLNQNISKTEALYEQYQSIVEEAGKANQALVDDSLSDGIKNASQTALNSLAEIETETNDLRSNWFETLGNLQKGSLKTIDAMKSALQKIAGGDYLSSDEFWGLAEHDLDNILNGAELVGDKFKVTEEQLISLKDVYVQKQIDSIKAENTDLEIKKRQTDELIKQAELEIQALGRRGLSNSAYRTQFEEANEQLRQAKKNSQEYGDNIYRNNLLIKQLNGSLGNTVDSTKALAKQQEKLNKAQKVVDSYAKAMTSAVQNVIDGFENEKDELESEKELLNDQLNILNEQKDALEDKIKQYKTIADIIKDETNAEIDTLKERKKAEEDAIQERIDALKDQQQQQNAENDLIEKQIDLRKKLAALEKAKSTKVRTYSEERGWHYDVSKEAVANAQTAVDEAQKAYDSALNSYDYAQESYDRAISELEQYKNDLAEVQNEIAEYNIDINKTVFGNIDTNQRQILKWTKSNLEKFADAIDSWELETEDLADSVSTILGTSSEYDGVEIAFSPILQTDQGAVLLTSDTVDKYIWGLIEKAGESWTTEQLLQLDVSGLEIDGQKIKKLLADIGDTAIQTGMAMHYVGKDGALAITQKEYETALTNVGIFEDALANSDGSQIRVLEKQKKAITESYDNQIKAYEDYYKQWEEITNEESKAEQEQLAEQIFGSEWREKIKAKDTQILNKFRNDFKSYNTQLNSLVKGEIESLKSSIKAKEDEIKAKNDQIDAWKRYKSQVETSVNAINSKYDNYMEKLGNLNITEQDSYETRESNLRTFAAQYESLIDEIQGYQNEINGLTIPVTVDDWDARQEMAKFIDDYRDAIMSMQEALDNSATGYGIVNSAWDARLADAANEMRRGSYASGGVVDYTGVAMVHGSKSNAETVFNASQSRELYNMVKSGSFVNQVADKAYAGLSTALNKLNNTTNNSSHVININGLTIKADNPQQFHDQFMREIGQYWNVKLSESRVR